MVGRAGWALPDYVLNVGDNFYWAGVEEHCNSGFISSMGTAEYGISQFDLVYEKVYNGHGLNGKQWLGVLGNHDYGGFRFEKGWDKAIGYTWTSPTGRWMTPAQYYYSKVWYYDFAVDYIFMDTNVWDALDPADGSPHNICSQYHNPGGASCYPGPTSVWDCPNFFRGLWDEQKEWLDGIAPGLNGDWRIVVTHFPPYWGWWDWEEMAPKNEIDLIITGHRHLQDVWVHGDPAGQIWPDDPDQLMSDFLDPTGLIVSGGGGGVTSENTPESSGEDDQYGFMDMTLSKDTIKIEAISHSGQTRKVSTINHHYAHKGSRLVWGDGVDTVVPTETETTTTASTASETSTTTATATDTNTTATDTTDTTTTVATTTDTMSADTKAASRHNGSQHVGHVGNRHIGGRPKKDTVAVDAVKD
jgi:hypothetical protein